MSAAGRLKSLDWEAYLAGEERAKRKHEYVYGAVYARAGGPIRHGMISSNILIAVGRRLSSGPCRAFNSDVKVRIRNEKGTCFYYPDAFVVYDSNPPDLVYQDKPVVVVEVLSPSTRRIDEREKNDGYLSVPSLAAYLLVESDQAGVGVWRRNGDEFKLETYTDLAASVPLPEIGVDLPLSEVYANVTWPAEPPAEED